MTACASECVLSRLLALHAAVQLRFLSRRTKFSIPWHLSALQFENHSYWISEERHCVFGTIVELEARTEKTYGFKLLGCANSMRLLRR